MIYGYNGTQYEAHEAVISPYDHGFLYGMGCFETMRTYGGRCFLLERHLERLEASLREIGIAWTPRRERLDREVSGLMEANGLEEAYVRISVSAGAEPLGLPGDRYERPNEIMMVKALPAEASDPSAPVRSRKLQVLRTRRGVPETPIRIKSFHYMNNIIGKRELASYPWAGTAEGLMLTDGGYVSEGLVSNVFFVEGSKLVTPSLDTAILPGITRAYVMELATQLGLETVEAAFPIERAMAADEAFLTNSVQEIVPVEALYRTDGEYRAFTAPGPITQSLINRYREQAWKGRAE